jgi:hypothetical protein
MPGCFTVGERLAEIALRRDSGQALATIVSDVGDMNDVRDMMPNLPPSKRSPALPVVCLSYAAIVRRTVAPLGASEPVALYLRASAPRNNQSW